MAPPLLIDDVEALVARARSLAAPGRRRVLGIAGAPGGGKSTLAETLVGELGELAVLVPMDGFHLARHELVRLGRRDRMGSPDTFDAAGYAALLRRLRGHDEEVVYAPEFRRESEDAIAGAIPVPASAPLVVTEGNYLLVDTGDWGRVRPLLDEAWYVDVDEELRVRSLIQRHVDYGKAPDEAREWVMRSDQRNAEIVAATRSKADVLVRLGWPAQPDA